jgi:GNAT superfamily N-acetyltransferase
MTTVDRLPIVLDLAPRAEDVQQVQAGLIAYNVAAIGPASLTRIALYVRDADGTIRAGLVGFCAWQWLSIELLWVDESLRGQGYGSALLAEAEAAGRKAGCIAARLDTYEFQARPFYERYGYVVYGELDGYPGGTRTYLMRKSLIETR